MTDVMFLYRLLLPCVFVSVSVPGLAAFAESEADVKAGAILYRDKGCAHCHGADTAGTKKAPSLAEIRNDKDWPAEKMADQILNGGQKMPPFRESLTDEEIAQLVTYLRAKNKPAPPPMPAGDASAPSPK